METTISLVNQRKVPVMHAVLRSCGRMVRACYVKYVGRRVDVRDVGVSFDFFLAEMIMGYLSIIL